MLDINKTHFKTVRVDNTDVFYREAGHPASPVLLLLHGFPTSSHMYRNLIPLLSDKFRVIAPDLPGFGSTIAAPRGEYTYTFDSLYKTIEKFTHKLSLGCYAIYVFDYGAPVGFRLATAHPENITAIISQNGNAYEEGLLSSWDPIRAYWENPSRKNRDSLKVFLTEETTHLQYNHGVPEEMKDLISPDAIAHDQSILDRDNEIQLDLFGDYQSNINLYPVWQEYFRTYKPPFLATWGKNDLFFGPQGAEAFKQDMPCAEVHLFDTGHFALETHGHEIATLAKGFLLENT